MQREQPFVSIFTSAEVPPIPLEDYLIRLQDLTECSDACFLLALVYLDRMSKITDRLTINPTSLNVHRLMLTAVLLAAKYADDVLPKSANKAFSLAGGIDLSELNELEAEFLFIICFNLHVTEREVLSYSRAILRFAQGPAVTCPNMGRVAARRTLQDGVIVQEVTSPSGAVRYVQLANQQVEAQCHATDMVFSS